MKKIRIGILGAARIVPSALIAPARETEAVEIAAIAARDEQRARAFAAKHQIPRVLGSYAEIIADPAIDAIYNPLPNSLHAEWTIRALEAGKHVLCEKPLTANAEEAERVAETARRTGRVCMEAFHWRYHPLAARMREVIASGELGSMRRVETWMCIPLPLPGDIRYRLDLAGGAMMDTGCYAVSMLRHLAGAEPRVLHAEAKLSSPGVDRWMRASMDFEGGLSGGITCSLFSLDLLHVEARVTFERGEMSALNPVAPQIYHHLTVRSDRGSRRERLSHVASYTCQLRAFAAAVLEGAPIPTPADDAVKNMRVIDAVYRAAGLSPRGLSS